MDSMIHSFPDWFNVPFAEVPDLAILWTTLTNSLVSLSNSLGNYAPYLAYINFPALPDLPGLPGSFDLPNLTPMNNFEDLSGSFSNGLSTIADVVTRFDSVRDSDWSYPPPFFFLNRRFYTH